MSTALIVVDVENDFCEGGALAVPGGASVAARISNWLRGNNRNRYDVVVVTRDWHNPPPDTNDGHFALDGDPNFRSSWPVHCVADTWGSEFHGNLDIDGDLVEVRKGQGRADYSGFQGTVVGHEGVGLADYLRNASVTDVDVVGIATEHCVTDTASDAAQAGFTTRVFFDLTAGLDAQRILGAFTQLRNNGVTLTVGWGQDGGPVA